MSVRTQLLKWLVPSKWVEWLQGKKSLLGVVSLALWALIYAVPAVCQSAGCIMAAKFGTTIQSFLLSVGVQLDQELLTLGVGLTVIGLVDKVVNHWLSKVVKGLFRSVEKPIAELEKKGK